MLWGRDDRLVPAGHAEGVRAALPQAEITLRDGMGHHPQRECPDVLARFLERALSRAEDTFAAPSLAARKRPRSAPVRQPAIA